MNEKEKKYISKTLSLVLRHRPEYFDLNMDENGWCAIDEILEGFQKKGINLKFEDLEIVVRENKKQRFAFSEDHSKIRANQGHSITINLGYEAIEPPEILYHGTAEKNLKSILKSGLDKRKRHHVHLSSHPTTAMEVGRRHGTPVVLMIQSRAMFEAGHLFFLSENEVWLTEKVPAEFIVFPEI